MSKLYFLEYIYLMFFLSINLSGQDVNWPLCDPSIPDCDINMFNVITGFSQDRAYGQTNKMDGKAHWSIDLNGFEGTDSEDVFSPVTGNIASILLDQERPGVTFVDIEIFESPSAKRHKIKISHMDLSSIGNIEEGDPINAGDYIGKIGKGFWSTRHSHIHVDVLDTYSNNYDISINPIKYFIDRGVDFVSGSPIMKSFDKDKVEIDTSVVYFRKFSDEKLSPEEINNKLGIKVASIDNNTKSVERWKIYDKQSKQLIGRLVKRDKFWSEFTNYIELSNGVILEIPKMYNISSAQIDSSTGNVVFNANIRKSNLDESYGKNKLIVYGLDGTLIYQDSLFVGGGHVDDFCILSDGTIFIIGTDGESYSTGGYIKAINKAGKEIWTRNITGGPKTIYYSKDNKLIAVRNFLCSGYDKKDYTDSCFDIYNENGILLKEILISSPKGVLDVMFESDSILVGVTIDSKLIEYNFLSDKVTESYIWSSGQIMASNQFLTNHIDKNNCFFIFSKRRTNQARYEEYLLLFENNKLKGGVLLNLNGKNNNQKGYVELNKIEFNNRAKKIRFITSEGIEIVYDLIGI